MSFRKLAFGGTSFCALMMAGSAFAQDSHATQVDELLIVTKSLEQTVPLELSKQGHDLVIVDDETIRDKSYLDVSSVLQMEVPGLYVSPQAGPFSYSYVSLQGSRAQDLLWTVDGIRINNRLYSGTLPTDTLPSSMIERVEVLKGGEGLFYGTQAVAGAINVVTRGFSDDLGGQVTVGGDTNDGVHADGFVRGAMGPHRYVAWASLDQADGYQAFDVFHPSATLRDRSYDVLSYGAKYGIDFSDDLSFSASWIHTDADLDYPSPVRVAFAQNSRDEDIIGAKLDYAPEQGLQFYVKAYHHDWDSHYTTIENLPGGGTVVTDDNLYWGYKDQGINALARLPVGGVDYSVGYDFQQYEARDEVLIIDNIAEDVHALFGQVAANAGFSDRYSFAAGVRFNKTGETDATVWNVTGRANVTDHLYVQGNVGTTFTLPTAENLFAVDPFSTFGNPFLEPEEGTSYNLSLGGRYDTGFEWMVTAFQRDIDNLITFSTDPAEIPDSIEAHPDFSGEAYINAGKAKFTGFEVLGSGPIANAWRWHASYTSNDAEVVGTPGQIGRIPETIAKAGLDFQPMGERYGASVTAIWTGDVFQSVPTRVEPWNYGGYYVVDLAAHLYFDEDLRHKLDFRIQNLFDEDYAARVTTAAPPGGGPRFETRYMGVPQTFHVRYTYRFGG